MHLNHLSGPPFKVPGLFRFLQDLDETPVDLLRNLAGLHDLNAVADAGFVVFVMNLELLGTLQDLLVEGVLNACLLYTSKQFSLPPPLPTMHKSTHI